MTTTEHGEGPITSRERWLTLVALLAAGVVVNFDRTMVVVALPAIARDLDMNNVDAVLTVNLIAFAVAAPGSGWLVSRFSARGVFRACLVIFAAVSAVAFLASPVSVLIACRAIQGLSAGIMMPTTFAVIHNAFPSELRPKAYALHAAVVMLSPAIGPVMGGLFADISWRLLFVVSAMGGAGALMLAAHIPAGRLDDAPIRLDWIGWLTAALSLPTLLVAFTMSSEWGLVSQNTLALLVIGLITLGAFIAWELVHAAPLVNLRMLQGATFRRTIALEWYVGIPYHVQLVVVPMSLITVADRTPLQAGLMLTPAAIGTISIMRMASRTLLEHGPRRPVTLGTTCLVLSTVGLTLSSAHTHPIVLAIWMLVLGMGAGLAMMPLTAAGLEAVDPDLVPQASAMRLLNKLLAQSMGVAIAIGLATWRLGATDLVSAATLQPQRADEVFRWLGWVLLAPALVAWRAGTRLPAQPMGQFTGREGSKAR